MDLKLIKKVLDLIAETELNEVSIEEGDFKIKVKKSGTVETVSYSQPAPVSHAAPQAPAAPAQSAPAPSTEEASSSADGDTVKSPIVGTFYKSPSPDSDPFVKVGDKVSKGDTICIVEAMKIMNEIEAEFGGEIVKILADDGQAVEFDQPLFVIKKG